VRKEHYFTVIARRTTEGTFSEKIDSSGNRKQRSGHFGSSSFQIQHGGLRFNHYEWRGEFDETNPEKLAKIRILDGVRCSWQGFALHFLIPCFSMVISDVVGELSWQPRASVNRSWQRNQLELRKTVTGSDEDAGYGAGVASYS
jgi:hypothetical protein